MNCPIGDERTLFAESFGGKKTKVTKQMPYQRKNVRRLVFTTTRNSAVAKSRARSELQRMNPLVARPFGGRSQLATEVKTLDVSVAQFNPPSAPAVVYSEPNVVFTGMTCLNEILQGNTYFTRVGSKAVMRSVELDFTMFDTNVAPAATNVRWMLVYDRQSSGAAPAIGEVLQDANPAAAVTFNSGINMQNRSRFMVLRDQRETLDSAQALSKPIHAFVRTRLDFEYRGTAGAITDLATGALLFLCFYDNAGISPLIADIKSRIRYYD